MADKIINSFDVWITAQGLKSKGRLRSVDNTSLEGLEKLRYLILQLAVRGKLTSQDDSDEPAKFTINRLKKEKEQKFGNEKPLPPIEKSEVAFPTPKNWEWCKLGEILTLVYGESLTKAQCIDDAPFPVYGSNGIVGYYDKYLTERRAIIIGRKGSAGALNISDKPSWTTDVAYYIEESEFIDFKFEFYLLKSLNLERFGKGIKPGVNRNEAYNSVLCVPPFAEQHRIVTKVDELMALCDELEKQETHHLKSHQLLVETLLGTLTQANDADEFQNAWLRLSQHFDDIFTTEDSIDQLKQTILQLAVMGKLVPQDPNDEPARILLQKIAVENDKKVKQKKTKKKKSSPAPELDSVLFEVPSGWTWCRFGEVALIESNLVDPKAYADYLNIAPDSIERGTGKLLFSRTVKEAKINSPNHLFHKGQILYSKIRPNLSKAVIAPYDGLCSADMYPIKSLINPDFLLSYILSKSFLSQIERLDNRIKMPKINQRELSLMLVAVPPLGEQMRIFAKLSQLFPVCDRLKEGINASQKVAGQIADSIVEQVR